MTTALHQLIFERIQTEGPITFAEYMRMALYDPQYGYYMTGPARMGWDGDYYTSSDVSIFFAHCMGRQLQQMWEKIGRPARLIVLEQGAGRGDLGQAICAWAAQTAPDFSAALDYRAEDIRRGQEQNAIQAEVSTASEQSTGSTKNERDERSEAPSDNSRGAPLRSPWDGMRSPWGGGLNTPSVIISNELVDAFPVHIVQVHDAQLYEVYIDVQAGQLCEVLDAPSSPQVAQYLDSYNVPWQTFANGWRAEINLDALRWMQQTARLIHKGFVLTIDYGDRARHVYTRLRPYGTLACYYRHQLNNRPLARPGAQDITAHVNFSALIDEGRRHGLRLNIFTTQRQWLQNMGIFQELEYLRASEFAAADTERATDRGQVALLQLSNVRQRVDALTDPAGMGNFKVLIMGRYY